MTDKKIKREKHDSTTVEEQHATVFLERTPTIIKQEMPEQESECKIDPDEEYELLCRNVNKISQPMASRKFAKKIYKLIKKASREKTYLRRGITDIQRCIRKGEKGT